jgi:SAM-dependent methyltransferase
MAERQIRFYDGAAYERYMGVWSRFAGDNFLDWLAPRPGLRWIDIGCGNGAFTELIVERCAPAEVQGIDPSEGQLGFARSRAGAKAAMFRQGDAMSLPFSENAFDVAVMALVIFYVPEPAKGVAEMARVVCPGGSVATYAWDMMGGGFPHEPIQAEMRAMGLKTVVQPNADASRMVVLQELWSGAGFEEIETRVITVQRSFDNFDDYWGITLLSPTVGATLATMTSRDVDLLKARMRMRLSANAAGQITYTARANVVKGRVPN